MPKQNPSATNGGGSPRINSNAVGRIVGPKSATMGGGNINRRGDVGRPGDPGGHIWEKAPSSLRGIKNRTADITTQLRKSGEAAKRSAAEVDTGKPNTTVQINLSNHQPRIGGHAN